MAKRSAPSPRPAKVPLYPILVVNFVGTLGFSIVLPFLVFLVTRWGGNALIYGLVGSTYSAFQLVGAPLLGRWSDVYGRKRVLLLSHLGTLASWLIFLGAFFLPVTQLLDIDSELFGSFTITLPLLVLFVSRATDGITGGNISVANAYLADITEESDRSTNFGKMAASSNLGFIAGPALAGLLAGMVWGEIVPVLGAMTISLLATAVIVLKLPESQPCILSRDPAHASVRKTFGQEHKECFQMTAAKRLSLNKLLRLRCVPTLLAVYFLVMLGFNFFYVAFPVHAVKALRWSVTETGVFFSVMSLMLVLVQGPVLGYLSRKLSDPTLIAGGSLILAASFAFFDSIETSSMYSGVMLLALGNGLMWPSVLSVLSRAAGDEYQGAVQGMASSAGAVASILGLAAGGVLYPILAGKVFWWSAAIILAVFLLAAISMASMKKVAR